MTNIDGEERATTSPLEPEALTGIDPVTYQVIGCALDSACREMGATTIQTATSPIIVEAFDFSCAILDHDGKLVATANYDPSHLAGMPFAVEAAIWEYGFDGIAEGDVIIHNDPYLGGTHVPDITVIRPLFADGELLGFAANRAHHVDVGGKSPGGLIPDATNIYAEGIRVPVSKWYSAGVENTDLFQLILSNIRLSELQDADFRAQLASCITAETRVAELCNRYGSVDVRHVMAARQDHSERIIRQVVAKLPDGVYERDDFIDDDGNDARAYRIRARVTVAGSDLHVDFSGSSAQALGPTNAAYGMTWASVFIALLQFSPKGLSFNGGCFRCVDVELPRGTLLSPQPPAPVFSGTVETCLRAIDAVVGAITEAAPQDLIGGTYGTAFCLGGGGWDPDRSAEYALFMAFEGGWGGGARRDGWNCTPNQTSNYKDTPVEVIEQDYPILCRSVKLRQDSAGPGRNRGGLGVERVFELRRGTLVLNCYADRFRVRPYGVFGGQPGAGNDMLVQRVGQEEFVSFKEAFETISPSKFGAVPLEPGDRILMATGGGGGYGSPLERDPDLVCDDARDEIVSLAQAGDMYGVVLTEVGDVDYPATERRRRQLRSEWDQSPPFSTSGASVWTDQEYMRLLETPDLVVPAPDDRISELVVRASESLDADICANECPRAADCRLCPWHAETALKVLSTDTYRRWTKRHCPQRASVLPNLPRTTA